MENGKVCPRCGEQKVFAEFRDPGVSRGRVPISCWQCRSENPDHPWCGAHGRPHPRVEFETTPAGRPASDCRQVKREYLVQYRSARLVRCVSCCRDVPAGKFRKSGSWQNVCDGCKASHPEERWCRDCGWVAIESFTPNGVGYYRTRCRACASAALHGMTVRQILERQGSARRECAACGSTDRLTVDHGHWHCPGEQGCPTCVNGYLCHGCNTAEGLLGTAERAEALARYMHWLEERRQAISI